jgi:hypothetical protein
MSDLLFQNLSTVQSEQQPKPNTIASTTTIAPTSFITFVSGTVDIGTITPPVSGQHMLVLVPTNAAPGDLLTTGNILVGSTTLTTNVPVLLFYDPNQAKYIPK